VTNALGKAVNLALRLLFAAPAEKERASCPTFTCPVCGMVSHNPNDLRYGYCGNCHDYTQPSQFL
jgi:ribosomal protein S27AE